MAFGGFPRTQIRREKMSGSEAANFAEILEEDPTLLLWCLDISTDSPFDSIKPPSVLPSTYSCSSLDAAEDLSGSGSEDEIHSSSSHSNKRTKRSHDPLDERLDKLLEGLISKYHITLTTSLIRFCREFGAKAEASEDASARYAHSSTSRYASTNPVRAFPSNQRRE